jgi:hypothetical protein
MSMKSFRVGVLLLVAAGSLAACGGGGMLEANPVCVQPLSKGGFQLAPMYKCEEGRGRMENAR